VILATAQQQLKRPPARADQTGVTARTRFRLLALLVAACLLRGAFAQWHDALSPAPPPVGKSEAYRLGPNDQVLVRVLDAEEIPLQPVRIDSLGNLNLPLVGRVAAAGLTVEELQNGLSERLGRFLREPQVTVTLAEVRSQPVAVLGAVNKPGVHQIESPLTLVEILSLAGGLREDAGHTIKITRQAEYGAVPLAGARADPSGRFSVSEVDVKEVLEARRPEDNIVIAPHDVISVPRAAMVYVIGEVQKSGGFVLEERQSVSVLQALSLAGGLTDVAEIRQARILRGGDGVAEAGDGAGRGADGAKSGGERIEIAVDLKSIMAGKSPDVALEPEDILFVPRSGARAAAQTIKKAAVGTLSGIAIWRVGAH
jgi:polysaccharide export outer membrane protein